MPIYEYQCSGCGKVFEIFQKISDDPLTECKECKGELNKLISNCAFHLKGSGWYATDYKKPTESVSGRTASGKTEKSESKMESAAEPASDSKTETKTEAKPEAKSEQKNSTTTTGG